MPTNKVGNCCCGGTVQRCFQVKGCFGIGNRAGATIDVTGPGGYATTLTTDASGIACFYPPSNGTYDYTVTDPEPGFAVATGSLVFSGSPGTTTVTLTAAAGYHCSACLECLGKVVPDTLYLTGTFGSATLTWNGSTKWTGSSTFTATDCYGGSGDVTVQYEFSCAGLLVTLPMCCRIKDNGGQCEHFNHPKAGGTTTGVSFSTSGTHCPVSFTTGTGNFGLACSECDVDPVCSFSPCPPTKHMVAGSFTVTE
jgi:hypothetical protein